MIYPFSMMKSNQLHSLVLSSDVDDAALGIVYQQMLVPMLVMSGR